MKAGAKWTSLLNYNEISFTFLPRKKKKREIWSFLPRYYLHNLRWRISCLHRNTGDKKKVLSEIRSYFDSLTDHKLRINRLCISFKTILSRKCKKNSLCRKLRSKTNYCRPFRYRVGPAIECHIDYRFDEEQRPLESRLTGENTPSGEITTTMGGV